MMSKCKECGNSYDGNSHYGICIDKFKKCVDCKIKDDDFTESNLNEILFIAGDLQVDSGVLH
jgi:hypothetical protein